MKREIVDKITIYNDNCLNIIDNMDSNSIDTIITDPPYGITFMNNNWDKGTPPILFWKKMLRVAKPGSTLLAMGSTRTFHRLVCAIEDAGWIIEDTIAWVYSGFAKSFDIEKGINKHLKNKSSKESELWHGWKSRLKPAMELICLASKEKDGTYAQNAIEWGVSGLNIEGSRVPLVQNETIKINTFDNGAKPFGDAAGEDYSSREENKGRYPANFIHDGSKNVINLFPGRVRMASVPSKIEKDSGFRFMSNVKHGQVNVPETKGSAARFFYCGMSLKPPL